MNEHSQHISALDFSARKRETCSFKIFLTWLLIRPNYRLLMCYWYENSVRTQKASQLEPKWLGHWRVSTCRRGDLRSQCCLENRQLTTVTLGAAMRLTVPMLHCAPVCQTRIADECYIYCPPTTSQSRRPMVLSVTMQLAGKSTSL